MNDDKPVWKKLLIGPNKYNVGLIFLFANMMGFISKMREHNVKDYEAGMILISLFILARLFV